MLIVPQPFGEFSLAPLVVVWAPKSITVDKDPFYSLVVVISMPYRRVPDVFPVSADGQDSFVTFVQYAFSKRGLKPFSGNVYTHVAKTSSGSGRN